MALNCLFNDLRYLAWVQAESFSSVAIANGPVYRRLFDVDPAIRNLTVRSLSTLFYRLMAELDQTHFSSHRERLAQFILLHASTDGTLRMTQQRIAHHLGTTREVIARLLREFVKNGILRTARGTITIRDLRAMRRVFSRRR